MNPLIVNYYESQGFTIMISKNTRYRFYHISSSRDSFLTQSLICYKHLLTKQIIYIYDGKNYTEEEMLRIIELKVFI